MRGRSSAQRGAAAGQAVCPGCGAPRVSLEEGTCPYCQRLLPDLTAPEPPAAGAAGAGWPPQPGQPVVVQVGGGGGVARAIVSLLTLAIVAGVAWFGYTKVTDTVSTATAGAVGKTTAFSLPEGVTLPPGVTVPAAASKAEGTGYLTPVANPQIKAPVNDLAKAIADLKAKVGRPVQLNDLHLYEDGRIIFSIQAADDPLGIDDYTWKRGQLGDQEQATIGARSAADFFPIDKVDAGALERICTTALAKTGVPGGFIDHPYLVNITGGPSWYIPVTNESRRTSSKTYRVSLDGKKEDVF